MIRYFAPLDVVNGSTLASLFDSVDLDFDATGGRNGSAALAMDNSFIKRATKVTSTGGVAWGQTSLNMACAVRVPGLNSATFLQWGGHVWCARGPDARLVFYRIEQFSPTVLAQSAIGALASSPSYPHVQAKVTIHPSTGSVAARINGQPVELFNAAGASLGFTATGLNTRGWDQSTNDINTVSVCAMAGSRVCDWVVWDGTGDSSKQVTDWLGDKRVYYSPVTGNGARTEGTIGGSSPAGSAYLSVNQQVPDEDVTFNSYQVNQANLYTWAGIPAQRRGIVALAPVLRVRKDDASTAMTVKSLLKRSDGVEVQGYGIDPTTGYRTFVGKIEEFDPVTNAAWQPGDAPQVGVIRTL